MKKVVSNSLLLVDFAVGDWARLSAVASVCMHFHFGKEQNNLSFSRISDYQLCLVFFCLGTRSNAEQTDLSEILPEDVEEQVKAAAEISMGTEVTFYFCGNDLSFDCKKEKVFNQKKKIVRLVSCLIAILNHLNSIVIGYETSNKFTSDHNKISI